MTDTILSLSLLSGQFKAVAVRRGTVTGTWERPGTLEDFSTFSTVLREAVEATGYQGDAVAMVLAHPRLTQQLVETPPIRGGSLKNFLDRRVIQLKTFSTDAAWSYQPTLATKSASAVVLHLFPKPFLDQLVQGCEQVGLHLAKLLPTTAVLNRQLTQLPVEEDAIVLLAAETGGTTTVLIGRKDGEIYLGRTLNSSWKVYPDRVNVDLNRTILYVKQQFGESVGSICLFGDGAEEHQRVMQAAVKVPVALSPTPPSPFYWNEEAQKLPNNDTNNLVSAELLQAPQRKRLLKVTSVIIGLAAIAAIATALLFQALVMDRRSQLDKLQPKFEKLLTRKGQLQERESVYVQQRDFVRLVDEEKVAAVPGWFLGYLGDVVPAELLLTHLQLKREDDLWTLQLGGTLQPTTNAAPSSVLSGAVSTLRNQLESGPFHVKILNSPGTPGGATGKRAARKPGQPGPVVALAAQHEFFIEGVMQ